MTKMTLKEEIFATLEKSGVVSTEIGTFADFLVDHNYDADDMLNLDKYSWSLKHSLTNRSLTTQWYSFVSNHPELVKLLYMYTTLCNRERNIMFSKSHSHINHEIFTQRDEEFSTPKGYTFTELKETLTKKGIPDDIQYTMLALYRNYMIDDKDILDTANYTPEMWETVRMKSSTHTTAAWENYVSNFSERIKLMYMYMVLEEDKRKIIKNGNHYSHLCPKMESTEETKETKETDEWGDWYLG